MASLGGLCCTILKYSKVRTITSKLSSAQLKSVRYAGHSHWNNVRHIKAAKDAIKQTFAAQLAIKLRLALRQPGGTNVKLNSSLAKAVKFGEDNNIPTKSIQSMIDKIVSKESSQTKVEARGPSGSMLIFDVSCEDSKRALSVIRKVLGKNGIAVLSAGATNAHFDYKGVITASPRDPANITLADVEDIAISVDAEDVSATSDSEYPTFEFTCDPDSMFKVMKDLSNYDVDISDYKVEPIPLVFIELSAEERLAIEKSVAAMKEAHEFAVDAVYDNIKW